MDASVVVDTSQVGRLMLAGGAIRTAQHRLSRVRVQLEARTRPCVTPGLVGALVLPSQSTRAQLAGAEAALAEALAQVRALRGQLEPAG